MRTAAVGCAQAPAAPMPVCGTAQRYLRVEEVHVYARGRAKLYESPAAVFADVVNGRIEAG